MKSSPLVSRESNRDHRQRLLYDIPHHNGTNRATSPPARRARHDGTQGRQPHDVTVTSIDRARRRCGGGSTFRVLGSVDVVAPDGSLVGPSGPRQHTLLAVLLAARGALVTRDRLAEALWGDCQPENPSAALHSQVARLREVLRAAKTTNDALETKPIGYVLNADDVDRAQFESLRLRAQDEPPHQAADTLAEALALWCGHSYLGVDDDAVRAEAARLDELRHLAAEEHSEALIASGRAAEAIPALESFITEHPLRERARACLMRALYAIGRHADALTQYDAYRRLLADELGLEPTENLRDLQSRILSRDLETATATSETPITQLSIQRTTGRRTASRDLRHLHHRYVSVGDRRVVWAEAGDGPPVVALPAWLSDLEVIASGRGPRSWLFDRLSARCRLVLYDRAGTGLSRASTPDCSLDYAVQELAAVVDAAGPPVVLLAISQAGPVALRFAAEYPEKVSGLVLYGTYASGPDAFPDKEIQRSLVSLVRAHWGMGSNLLADLYQPGARREVVAHIARLMRDSAPADVAADLLAAVYEADASEVLEHVDAPALVMHYRGDRVVPFHAGEAIAAQLSRSSFTALDGAYHLPDVADLDRIEAHVTDFIAAVGKTAS
jgi:DNA-binding SARP family transcriptional activator/pimeloyl-ACP methyl ester carboxylesterase